MKFDQIYLVYDSISKSSSTYDALSSLLSLTNNTATTRNIANSVFHRQGRLRHLGSMTSSDAVKFVNSDEARVLSYLVEELSTYIRDAEEYRGADNKILSLSALLIFSNLNYLLKSIYLPSHLRDRVFNALDYLSNESQRILEETKSYIIQNSNIDENYLNSLSTTLLVQRTDKLVHLLKVNYGPEVEDLYDYLSEQKYRYNKITSEIDREAIFNELGISNSTYFRVYKSILNDLSNKLSSDSQSYLLTALL